jgi:hypothetical protein
MRPVDSVSFPRSGHKLTTDLLMAYFGAGFVYAGEGEHRDGVHFLKHHDEDLNLPVDPTHRYLVQIRDPFDSMHSWFRMTVEADGLKDSRAAFNDLFLHKLDYWAGFVKKWVLTEYPNVWVFHYKDLVQRPSEVLRRIIPIFGEKPDDERIVSVVRSLNISPRRMPPFQLL